MTFNPAIPAANNLLSIDQANIQTNFSQCNTIFGLNHVEFNDATVANRGKHKFSSFIEQALDPATAANEIAMYTKDLAGITTLYLRKESNGTVIQMSGVDPVLAVPGQTFLPGGVIMKWGTRVVDIAGTNIVFVVPFPNNIFHVSVTPETNTSRGSSVENLVVGGFRAHSENNGTTFRWIAIGN